MTITIQTSGTPEGFGPPDIRAQEFIVSAPSSNTDTVYVDVRTNMKLPTTDETLVLADGPSYANKIGIPVYPGGHIKLPGPLSRWEIDGTTSDKVSVVPVWCCAECTDA